jgi:sugar-specific transcriptional regulator TrmB
MNEMVTRLMQFGFTNYEAKAYLALLQKHPAIGYEVSKIARIPTAKIYETLARLQKKGAVYCSASQPTLYLPEDPKTLIGRLEREFSERLESLGGLLSTPDPCYPFAVNLETCGASSLKRLGKRLNTVVVDSKEVVMGELGTEDDSAGVWATTPCLVLAAKEYIRHDVWGKALIDEVGPQRFDAMCRGNDLLSYLIQQK